MNKIIAVCIAFFALGLFQISVMPYTAFHGFVFNIAAGGVIALALAEKKKSWGSVAGAAGGGLALDIFSNQLFGFWIVALVVCAVFLKYVARDYVQIPVFKKIFS